MGGTLWLVATPIGNLADLSPRAREVLGQVDLVACEDTRRTGRLLAGLKIKVPLVSYFEGNERERVGELLARLRNGDDVALVTDGGTPAVSDPGFPLVRACIEEGVEVQVVPGPSAAIAALVVSGLPTDRFVFEGFLPKRPGERVRRLEALRHEPRTVVVFESPLRVQTLLRDVLVAIGDRDVAVVRELTKLHEHVERGRVSQVLSRLGDTPLKGEVVVVIGGERNGPAPDMAACAEEARVLVAGGMRKRDAAHAVADRHKVSANELYRALLDDGR
ncbi:MAG TPA: 16S rRNA (cytidine(1402)-2'-O)-methyltransferase [Actinomycetota bacterium]|nr:16S rRNA (cytidine(1402)-2'-O)-methyltransferase [Actinomycetota bacterium]